MKTNFLVWLSVAMLFTVSCKKSNDNPDNQLPRTDVPAELAGSWMYGNFSLTEYWDQNPEDYLGNALEFSFAFTFNPNGTYTQYFTSRSVFGGVTSYQQSVSHGTVEVDAANHQIVTHTADAHYKKTSNGSTVEERDLREDELSGDTVYTYELGTEPNGTRRLNLTLDGTEDPLSFLWVE